VHPDPGRYTSGPYPVNAATRKAFSASTLTGRASTNNRARPRRAAAGGAPAAARFSHSAGTTSVLAAFGVNEPAPNWSAKVPGGTIAFGHLSLYTMNFAPESGPG